MLRVRTAVLIVNCTIVDIAAAQGAPNAFRNLDLNSYALGMNVLVSSSPYEGIEDFVVLYPAPTTYGSSIETDDTFFIRDGNFGLRTQLANDTELGGVLSIQTLGYGSSQSTALAGMRRRNWTVQGGLAIGRRFGAIRADFFAQTDLLGEHDGEEYELKLARTFDRGDYYFAPQVDVTYQSSDLVEHYFGVTAAEALPDRPEYLPGAGITYGASLEWGWKWHPNWFLTANLGVDFLPAEIRSSPLVDKDYTYQASVGFSYDAPALIEAGAARPIVGAGLEIAIGVFFAGADSKVFLTDGIGTVPIDLESDFRLRDAKISVPVDASWRINDFHRIELGYFELSRGGAEDIVIDIELGDASFIAGDLVDTSFETRVFKLGYAFSLLHDTQKELSIFGGLHISDTSFRSASAGDRVDAETRAILPVLGADLQVSFAERLSLGARLNLFLSDFNRYSGSLIDVDVFGQFRWHERFSIGAGVRFYRQDIDSADESFFGDYRFDYRGPHIFVKARL